MPGGPPRVHRGPAAVAGGALVVLVVLMLGWVSARAITLSPSFDGAMNLQVSWSLAHGEGYRRTYADRAAFPREVQSNAPLTVPAAAVYRLFGMGTAQSQAVSLAYLYALVMLSGWIVGRRFGLLAGASAALAVLVTPHLVFEGLKAYGEVPGLAWSLAALCLLPFREGQRWRPGRLALAGACLGFAVATKTVMAICAGTFGAVILVGVLCSREDTLSRRAGLSMALAAGFLLPLAAIEAWRLSALGGPVAWQGWWLEQWKSISMQSGARAPGAVQVDYLDKAVRHVRKLAVFHAMPPALVLAWILLPFTVLFPLMASRFERRHLPLLALLSAIALYFIWWIFLTPSSKAWHRRIMDACLMLSLAWVYLSAWLLQAGRARPALRIAGAVSALAVLVLGLHFAKARWPAVQKTRIASDYAPAVEFLRGLPADARIYALGWHSAPHISLLAERPFGDFNDLVFDAEARRQPIWLVADSHALRARHDRLVVDAYASRAMLPASRQVQVYEVDLSRPLPPTQDDIDAAEPMLVLTRDTAAPVRGFTRATERGRAMGAEGFVHLRYDGHPAIYLRGIAAPPHLYPLGATLEVRVSLDGCPLGHHRFAGGRVEAVRLVIPEQCLPQPGAIATLRLEASDIVQEYIGKGGRPRSLHVSQIGFAEACPAQADCPRPPTPPVAPDRRGTD